MSAQSIQTNHSPKDRYYFVRPNSGTNVAFSDLLARESGNYESVKDFERVPHASSINSAQYSCERCYREIGNRPFCYRCFGPTMAKTTTKRNAWKVVLWVFIGIIVPVMVFMCFSMCIMHLYRIGLYRDDDVAQLKEEMRIALAELRYLSTYTDGFTNTFNRNMSYILSNIFRLKVQVAKNKSIWPKHLKNIQEMFNASCEEYSKSHNNTRVANICHLVYNGTYFN